MAVAVYGDARISIIFELPFSSTHRTVLLHLLCVQPLQYAVHVEAVRAFSPHQRAVVAGQFAVRTAAVELRATDAARVVVRLPVPNGDTRPLLHLHAKHGAQIVNAHAHNKPHIL